MPANDILEISVDAILNGQNVTNVMRFIQVGVDGSGDARVALANVWVNQFDGPLRNTQVTAVAHQQLRVRRLLPTQTQTIITPNLQPGTLTGVGIPVNQCVVLRFYGTPAGRKGTGNQRMYGIRTISVLDGRIDNGQSTLIQTYAVLFTSTQADISGYSFRGVVLGNDNLARQIERTTPLPRIRTMHSRTVGVGD